MEASLAHSRSPSKLEHGLTPYLAALYLVLSVLVVSQWARALLVVSSADPDRTPYAEQPM